MQWSDSYCCDRAELGALQKIKSPGHGQTDFKAFFKAVFNSSSYNRNVYILSNFLNTQVLCQFMDLNICWGQNHRFDVHIN